MTEIYKLPESYNIPQLTDETFRGVVDWAKNMTIELNRIFVDNNNKINNHTWKLIHIADIATAVNDYTISNINGDADKTYMIICRFRNSFNGAVDYVLKPNNTASGSNAYGTQYVTGDGTNATTTQVTDATGMAVGYVSAQNDMCHCNGILFAKSGVVRTFNASMVDDVNASTIGYSTLKHSVWNDTSTVITSLKFYAYQNGGSDVAANGIGIGSYIELWSK